MGRVQRRGLNPHTNFSEVCSLVNQWEWVVGSPRFKSGWWLHPMFFFKKKFLTRICLQFLAEAGLSKSFATIVVYLLSLFHLKKMSWKLKWRLLKWGRCKALELEIMDLSQATDSTQVSSRHVSASYINRICIKIDLLYNLSQVCLVWS